MKIAPTVAFVLAARAAAPSFAQTTPPQMDWMGGTLTGRHKEESCIGPQGNTMTGTSLSHSARQGTSFEFMRIVESARGLSFWAAPNGQTPVEFKLKEAGQQRIVFENPEREFPQRIHYWREGAVLRARIEGTRKASRWPSNGSTNARPRPRIENPRVGGSIPSQTAILYGRPLGRTAPGAFLQSSAYFYNFEGRGNGNSILRQRVRARTPEADK
jgi:hypothetical protein